MLLGILMATMTNKTGFERRESFLPPASPAVLLSAHLGDFPQCDLTQPGIKPTHPPLAPLTPTTVLFIKKKETRSKENYHKHDKTRKKSNER